MDVFYKTDAVGPVLAGWRRLARPVPLGGRPCWVFCDVLGVAVFGRFDHFGGRFLVPGGPGIVFLGLDPRCPCWAAPGSTHAWLGVVGGVFSLHPIARPPVEGRFGSVGTVISLRLLVFKMQMPRTRE